MKSPTIFFAIIALACAVLPTSLHAKDPIDLLKTESLGAFKDGTPAAAVTKALGDPAKKSADQKEEATGDWVQTWSYPAQGLKLTMASAKKGGVKTISTITAGGACKLATARGIKIGSSLAEVSKAYGDVESKEDSQKGKSFVAGSIYGGVIFTLKDGKVSEIFLGAAAE